MITGLSEIVLVVKDVPKAAAFYQGVVGLEPEREPNDQWAWFRMGEGDHPQRLALTAGPLMFEEHSPRPPAERFGPVHFALRVPRQDFAEHIVRLRTAGVTIHGPARLEWMRAESVYFYDPDANMVELWSPDPAS